MQYLNHILDSYKFVKQDFVSIRLDIPGITDKLLDFLFVVLLFFCMYAIGKTIFKLLFKNTKLDQSSKLIYVAIGYICISSTIFLFGVAGILFELIILLFLFLLLLSSIFILRKETPNFKIRTLIPFDTLSILVYIFILIAFLRLIPPQTAGDPIDYHLRYPRIYLNENSMMISPLGDESYTTIPHLPEMLYVPAEILNHGEPSRIIHFGFYILVVILLFNANSIISGNRTTRKFSALLFVSAPIVLENSTAAFSDMPALLCILLSAFILFDNKIENKKILLSGLLFGGALASKIWVLYYLPFYLLLLVIILKRKSVYKIIRSILHFLFTALIITFPWYLRGYILSGNPLNINDQQGRNVESVNLVYHLLNSYSLDGWSNKFRLIPDFGFTYHIGLVAFLINIKSIRSKIRNNNLYFSILILSSILIPVGFSAGRYTFPYMVPIFILSAFGLTIIYKYFLGRVTLILIFTLMILYYLFNTLVILPYGFSWADKNNFLTRNLLADKRSYYDFGGKFNNNFETNETIVTYGMSQLYYAPFIYKNAYYFYDFNSKKLTIPNKYNKLLIRGGDFDWFCKDATIANCYDYKVELIVADEQSKLHLYEIKMNNEK